MIRKRTNDMEIKPGQWFNRDHFMTNDICGAPCEVIRVKGERVYYIETTIRTEPYETYMMVRSIAFISDTQAEAEEMYRLSRAKYDEIEAIRKKYNAIVDQITATWKRDDEATQLTLMLVSLKDVPIEAIAAWTDAQCKEAEQWAGAVHFHASDNDDVVVPPFPEFLKPYDKDEPSSITGEY